MPDEFAYDVFLSHSAKDKAVVRDVAERLRKDGVKVWFDEWMLKPGNSIPAKIEEGLERSRVLVLCMSANAFGSDWAQLESGTFRFRDPLNKERRFLPLRIDDAPIKGSLAQFHYINWLPPEPEREYPRLLQAISTLKDVPDGNGGKVEYAQPVCEIQFSAVVETCIMSNGRQSGTAWYLESDQRDGIVFPIFFLMYVKVTNVTSKSVRIDSYSVETEVLPGIWRTALPMFAKEKHLVYAVAGNLATGLRMDCTGSLFNTHVGVEAITPGGTIEGWVFLDTPVEGKGNSFRLRTIDAAGHEAVQQMAFSKMTPGMLSNHKASFKTSGKVNLSDKPVRYYREFAYHS